MEYVKKYKKIVFGVVTLILGCIVLFFTLGAKERKEQGPFRRESAGVELTRDFFPVEQYSYNRTQEEIDHIVIHFTSAVMTNKKAPYNYEANKEIFLKGEVSSHYLIDRQGVIYQWIPEDRTAWHAGKGQWQEAKYTDKMNYYSVGIELMAIGSKEEMAIYMSGEEYDVIATDNIGFTEEQYESLNILLDDICTFYPEIEKDRNHILGHDQYSKTKVDPGTLFDWSKIGLGE